MPIDLQGSNFHSNAGVFYPGAYDAVLRRLCEYKLYDASAWLLASENPMQLAAFERRYAAQVAASVERRRGQTVHCLSHHLPDAVRENFPRGQRSFAVSADDLVTLMPLRGTRLMVQSLCGLGLVGRGPL